MQEMCEARRVRGSQILVDGEVIYRIDAKLLFAVDFAKARSRRSRRIHGAVIAHVFHHQLQLRQLLLM